MQENHNSRVREAQLPSKCAIVKNTLVKILNFASTNFEDFHIYINQLARFSRHELPNSYLYIDKLLYIVIQ